uniref:Uncharacterized protein n=1 Tax=Anabas testudineus TaxID=64144 RepID=A0A3Q1HXJ9_ANATE
MSDRSLKRKWILLCSSLITYLTPADSLLLLIFPPNPQDHSDLRPTVTFESVSINLTKPGEDVTLQCQGPRDEAVLMLRWTRADLTAEDGYVFFMREKHLSHEKYQLESYRGRVELKDPEMKDGDVSVILKNVNINDAGTYECYVGNGNGILTLINIINLTVTDSGELVCVCTKKNCLTTSMSKPWMLTRLCVVCLLLLKSITSRFVYWCFSNKWLLITAAGLCLVLSSDFCQLTIDTNTVNRKLRPSDNNRKVTHVEEDQSYPDHPDRFDQCLQLLCSNGLTGRCYWEVEWSGVVDISVSYRGIRRRGDSYDCVFGWNDQSWSLRCSDDGYSVCHNNRSTSISSSVSHRVSVYVDCPAGTLSFYRVSSDKLIHLHTFNTTFTEPLYPGFGFVLWRSGSSVCLSGGRAFSYKAPKLWNSLPNSVRDSDTVSVFKSRLKTYLFSQAFE